MHSLVIKPMTEVQSSLHLAIPSFRLITFLVNFQLNKILIFSTFRWKIPIIYFYVEFLSFQVSKNKLYFITFDHTYLR